MIIEGVKNGIAQAHKEIENNNEQGLESITS